MVNGLHLCSTFPTSGHSQRFTILPNIHESSFSGTPRQPFCLQVKWIVDCAVYTVYCRLPHVWSNGLIIAIIPASLHSAPLQHLVIFILWTGDRAAWKLIPQETLWRSVWFWKVGSSSQRYRLELSLQTGSGTCCLGHQNTNTHLHWRLQQYCFHSVWWNTE